MISSKSLSIILIYSIIRSKLNLDSLEKSNLNSQVISIIYLILTFILLCFIYVLIHFFKYKSNHYYLIYMTSPFIFLIQIAILCCNTKRKLSYNYIILLLFTVSENYTISFVKQ